MTIITQHQKIQEMSLETTQDGERPEQRKMLIEHNGQSSCCRHNKVNGEEMMAVWKNELKTPSKKTRAKQSNLRRRTACMLGILRATMEEEANPWMEKKELEIQDQERNTIQRWSNSKEPISINGVYSQRLNHIYKVLETKQRKKNDDQKTHWQRC